jgi:ABC-2 type transport system permease protein
MLVKPHESLPEELIRQVFSSAFEGYQVELTHQEQDAVRTAVAKGNAACAFVMTASNEYIYYVETLSMYDTNSALATEALQQVYRMNAMIGSGMTAEEAEAVMNIAVTGTVENLGKDQTQNFFYTYIMVFALYMVILLYGQMVATNVASEKSSRAMELLITSAKPTSMMFGKVIASCLAGLSQLIAIFGSSLVFYALNKDYWADNMIMDSIFNIPPELLVYMLVYFILGFLLYAFLFGAVGSTVSKMEDISTSISPINFLFVAGFLVAITGMTSGDTASPLMVFCSYFPFTASSVMFTRIAMSTVPLYEVILSMAILAGSTVGIGVIAAKIYRLGVLMYGKPPKITSLVKMIFR